MPAQSRQAKPQGHGDWPSSQLQALHLQAVLWERQEELQDRNSALLGPPSWAEQPLPKAILKPSSAALGLAQP